MGEVVLIHKDGLWINHIIGLLDKAIVLQKPSLDLDLRAGELIKMISQPYMKPTSTRGKASRICDHIAIDTITRVCDVSLTRINDESQ